MSRAARETAQRIERAAAVTGLPPVMLARMYGAEAAEAAREERAREARRQAAIDAAADAVMAHQMACREAGLPETTSAAEFLALRNPLGDEPSRDRSAPPGSASNPVQFFGGTDHAYQQRRREGTAQRSLSEARDEDLLRRARAMQADTYMKAAIARSKLERSRVERGLPRRVPECEQARAGTQRRSEDAWHEYPVITR